MGYGRREKRRKYVYKAKAGYTLALRSDASGKLLKFWSVRRIELREEDLTIEIRAVRGKAKP